MKNSLNRKLKILLVLFILLAAGFVSVVHILSKRYGYSGIGDLWSTYWHNRELASNVEPETMTLLVNEDDYAFLKDRRDKAIERGIQINDGEDNYVKCKIVVGGDTVKGEMRLKGHMTDHLQGDKWSFRVKTDKKPVMGMTRFSLQEPGTRNYAYEWVYHQLLKEENIIHLKYDFIKLQLNEKDLGIYAIEEHFGQHVLEHNNRPPGAILRWNPNLYWEWRIDELQGIYLDEQYSDFASSYVEPYEKGTVEDDSVLLKTYLKGAQLLEGFRRGKYKASEVFDLNKMASFHAIIDLVGGHHSLDWSDVKFYFNSETKLIEPVGYESFSVRKSEMIAGQRLPNDYDPITFDYHNQLFRDPEFFEAYVNALERICQESYLRAFIDKIQPELDKKLGVIAHEYAYKKFTFDGYFENIELIRHNLQMPKPFHAFLEDQSDSTVLISLAPVSDFPIEILAMSVDDKKEYTLRKPFMLPAKARNTYAHYFTLIIPHDSKKLKNLKLMARIPGSDFQFETAVSELPSYRQFHLPDQKVEKTNLDSLIQLNDTVLMFRHKQNVISEPVFIESNYTLMLAPGQELIFADSGALIVSGRLILQGQDNEDLGVLIKSTTVNSGNPEMARIKLLHAELIATNTQFVGEDHFIFAENSTVTLLDCQVADAANFLCATQSDLILNSLASGSVSQLLFLDRCTAQILHLNARRGEVCIRAAGSDVDLRFGKVENYHTFSRLDYASSLSSLQIQILNCDTVGTLNNASDLKFYAGSISASNVGFSVDVNTSLPGKSSYLLYKTTMNEVKQHEVK